MSESSSRSVNDDTDADDGGCHDEKRPKVDRDYDPCHDFLRPKSSCPSCMLYASTCCRSCYDEKQRETWFIEWNDKIRQARETEVERTKTEHSIDTACHFDEVNIARLVMEYLLEKSGASIVEIGDKENDRQYHEAFIVFINTYKVDTLSHIPVQVTFRFITDDVETFHVTRLVKAMLSYAQNQCSVTFSLREIDFYYCGAEICTDFLASEMLKATPASRAVFGTAHLLLLMDFLAVVNSFLKQFKQD
jgi:hypothetical protein